MDADSRGRTARSPRIYRALKWGQLADLVMLDTRLVGRDQQAATREDVAVIESPTRSLLGRAQEAWLHTELAESRRTGTRWQLLGQQVMFAPQSAPGRPAGNPDSWDGYRSARDRVFDMVEQLKLDSFIVLTGDVHSSSAYDFRAGRSMRTIPAPAAVPWVWNSPALRSPRAAASAPVPTARSSSRRSRPPGRICTTSTGDTRLFSGGPHARAAAGGFLRHEDDPRPDGGGAIREGICGGSGADAPDRTGVAGAAGTRS